MVRHLLRFCVIAREGCAIHSRCWSSSPVTSISIPKVHPERTSDAVVRRKKMISAGWKRRNWDGDPAVKSAFNEIVKGSRLFTPADTCNAIKHFSALAKKAKVSDNMAVKMAAVVTTHLGLEEGRKILNAHYLSHGAESRFAGEASLLDEQVEGALRRIFASAEGGGYEVARQFYCSLIDLRFCKVKNGALKIFVQHLLNKNEIKRAVEELDYFSSYGKHGSLSGVAFLVLRAAFRKNEDLLEKARKVTKASLKSRLQQICVTGSVFLAEGFHIRFVDFLREQDYNISVEDVEFICDLARNCKEPAILESFVDVHELFNLSDELRARIYGSLIEIHGKASNLNGLLKIWERVIAEKNLNKFRVVILKLGHFYKCNDFLIPADLQYYLKQYRE